MNSDEKQVQRTDNILEKIYPWKSRCIAPTY